MEVLIPCWCLPHSSSERRLSQSVHVQQRLTGCELLDSDQPGSMAVKDAFNGQSGDQLSFTNDQHSFWSQWQWPAMWDKLQFGQVKWLYENLYHPICMRTLRTYLHKHKNRIMRKANEPSAIPVPIVSSVAILLLLGLAGAAAAAALIVWRRRHTDTGSQASLKDYTATPSAEQS
ncbi:hypothetical protein ACEWY4_011962 [Coilia grayii]|uniref:MHC class I antigen n=1 Tax=Coilia grayii TaxID=363190 RepID=A0ABD1JZ58_9TELE